MPIREPRAAGTLCISLCIVECAPAQMPQDARVPEKGIASLCDNTATCLYTTQPSFPAGRDEPVAFSQAHPSAPPRPPPLVARSAPHAKHERSHPGRGDARRRPSGHRPVPGDGEARRLLISEPRQ